MVVESSSEGVSEGTHNCTFFDQRSFSLVSSYLASGSWNSHLSEAIRASDRRHTKFILIAFPLSSRVVQSHLTAHPTLR
jgi:hypothetical protein